MAAVAGLQKGQSDQYKPCKLIKDVESKVNIKSSSSKLKPDFRISTMVPTETTLTKHKEGKKQDLPPPPGEPDSLMPQDQRGFCVTYQEISIW